MYAGSRLFIVDPSLQDIRGHHYTLTRCVTGSAKALGFDVTWLASMKASNELQGMAEMSPTFDLSMYDSYTHKPKSLLARLFGSIVARGKAKKKAGAEASFANLEASLFDGLRSAMKAHNIGVGDRLLFHTADGATYRTLARLISALPQDALPMFHVCTPYDPQGVMPNRISPEVVAEAVQSLKTHDMLERQIFLYGENAYLAEHLSKIWGAKVRPLELPVEAPTDAERKRAGEYRANILRLAPDCFMITSLGAARLEKGFHLFPDIIQRTFEYVDTEDYPNVQSENIKFVLQASEQIIGRHPVLANAITRLEDMPCERVELLLTPLSNVDYRNLLLASDAVMMPYDEAAYRVRGSGVVAEALAAAKFIIAKPGSFPGAVAVGQGGETGLTPRELAKSLLSIINDRQARIKVIKNTARDYVSANKTEAYIEKIIAAEQEAYGPSVVG